MTHVGLHPTIRAFVAAGLVTLFFATTAVQAANEEHILTPKPLATPRINGPSIFGVRPGSPFLYRIPATGDRPMQFSVDGLPAGLSVDAATGQITGKVNQPGTHTVTLKAKNDKGTNEKKFRIVVGEEISLTPAMGWNSWNCFGPEINQEKILNNAKAMASSGLINHGWTYLNIDDAWQGKRGGEFNAIQGNENFPDMKGLCDAVHALGLKVGIYSTPWCESYARFIGGSAENPEGTWEKSTGQRQLNRKVLPNAVGKYSFATNDAKQWGAWGIDYLKYDWSPNEEPETAEMAKALRESGRDVVFSLSNNTPFENVNALSKHANSWRNTGDIRDNWFNVMGIVMKQPRWTGVSRPGHWNDPDMLVVGVVDPGRGRNLHPSNLTPDQQYFHISLWSLLASPLLIGCDMTQLDDFTLNLLTNDEVLAINQDPLGKQAQLVFRTPGEKVADPRPPAAGQNARPAQERDSIQIYARDLEDGTKAVGLFNLREEGGTKATATWKDLGLTGPCIVRDVWRQKDIGEFDNEFSAQLPACGSMLVKITPKK